MDAERVRGRLLVTSPARASDATIAVMASASSAPRLRARVHNSVMAMPDCMV